MAMSATLEATLQRTGGGATYRAAGDIDGSAREALDAAYTAVAGDEPLLLDFSRRRLHQLDRDRADRRAAGPGPRRGRGP